MRCTLWTEFNLAVFALLGIVLDLQRFFCTLKLEIRNGKRQLVVPIPPQAGTQSNLRRKSSWVKANLKTGARSTP